MTFDCLIDGYRGDAYNFCSFNQCDNDNCAFAETCNFDTGNCDCRENYSRIKELCVSPHCPGEAVNVTENHFGYAIGEISSPFYGVNDYPTHFDCNYTVEAPRSPNRNFIHNS